MRRGRGRPGSLPEVGEASFLGEQVVNRGYARPRIEPEVQRRMRLRIDIDQADALTGAGERGAEVHGRRCFSDAAFLIDDGDGAHGRGRGWGLGTGGYSRPVIEAGIIGDAGDAPSASSASMLALLSR